MVIFLKGECDSVFSSLCGWANSLHNSIWENLGSIFKTSAMMAQSLKDSTNAYIFIYDFKKCVWDLPLLSEERVT